MAPVPEKQSQNLFYEKALAFPRMMGDIVEVATGAVMGLALMIREALSPVEQVWIGMVRVGSPSNILQP